MCSFYYQMEIVFIAYVDIKLNAVKTFLPTVDDIITICNQDRVRPK